MLLGDAVEGAAAPDEIAGVDRDDGSIGDEFAKHVEGGFVGFAKTEDGDDHDSVGDVEVTVAFRDALALDESWRRSREPNDLEQLVVGIAHRREMLELLFELRCVLVIRMNTIRPPRPDRGGQIGQADRCGYRYRHPPVRRHRPKERS